MNYILGQPYIEINSICNLSCLYCYHEKRENSNLSFEDVCTLVESLKELGASDIKISGGEPMLHDNFFDILRYIKKCGLTTNVVTNGTKIDLDNAKLLKELCDQLVISLDSWNEAANNKTRTNSHSLVIKALEALHKVNARNYYIGVVATKYNSDIFPVVNFCKEYNIQGIIFESIHREGKAKEIFDEYFLDYAEYQKYKRATEKIKEESSLKISPLPGFGGGCMLVEDIPIIRPRIDYKGNVYLCRSFLDQEMSVGNIHEKDIAGILNSNKSQIFIDTLRRRVNECIKCQKCFCKGDICQCGCAAQAYNRTGRILDVDDLCEWRKKQYIDLVKHAILG